VGRVVTIMPWLYRLMLETPMSSPQMTKMFGFLGPGLRRQALRCGELSKARRESEDEQRSHSESIHGCGVLEREWVSAGTTGHVKAEVARALGAEGCSASRSVRHGTRRAAPGTDRQPALETGTVT